MKTMNQNSNQLLLLKGNRILVKAYDRYLLYWMASHGFSITNLCDFAESWAQVISAQNIEPADYPLLDCLRDSGLNKVGESYAMWPSMEEFEDHEYLDVSLMHAIMDKEDFVKYMAVVHQVKVLSCPQDPEKEEAPEEVYLKYWSTAEGKLHHNWEAITENDLPEDLKEAYHKLWSAQWKSLCCLVETPKGYGIALVNEYVPKGGWREDPINHEAEAAYFKAACVDASAIKAELGPYFPTAEVLVAEYNSVRSPYDAHSLVVTFPAKISAHVFEVAADVLDKLALRSLPIESRG